MDIKRFGHFVEDVGTDVTPEQRAAVDPSKVAVTTRGYSNLRQGANLNESILTALNVQQKGIKKLFDCVMPGDGRGSEGQPLIVPNLVMADGMVHDVLFACTMGNDIYAFDANTPDPRTGQGQVLWKQHIGNPVQNQRSFDMYLINDQWGILSTPVIDVKTKTLYCTALHSPDGTLVNGSYYLHAINLINGEQKAPPIDLDTATYQPPDGLPLIKHGQQPRKQRSALVFDSRDGVDTVFIADSTFAMMNKDAHGFVIAVDVTDINEKESMSIAATWTATSRYAGAGIWMASGGMIVDEKGFLYAFTANGAFDGKTDFGSSFIKLQYTPKSGNAAASIQIVDWWCPYTDAGRLGKDPTIPWVGLIGDWGNWQDGQDMTSPADQDLGSAAPILLPRSQTGFTKDVILGAGKDGILYVCDANNMGKTQLDDFRPSKIAGNWRKLLMPPYGFTYYPGDTNLTPTNLGDFHTTYGGFTHHQHANPLLYKSPDHGWILYGGGENGPVRAFNISQNKDGSIALKYLGQGTDVASAGVPAPGGMPGPFCSLSANGSVPDTAVLWAILPIGDANKSVVDAHLIAYGANWIEPGGVLKKLWDSRDWGISFKMNKFCVPTCANGKLYVPSYDGRIIALGLGNG